MTNLNQSPSTYKEITTSLSSVGNNLVSLSTEATVTARGRTIEVGNTRLGLRLLINDSQDLIEMEFMKCTVVLIFTRSIACSFLRTSFSNYVIPKFEFLMLD